MGKVTDLRRGRSRGKRVNVFLDGRFAFNLQAEVIAKDGLQVGQDKAKGRHWPGPGLSQ